jgi:hypothetical protein
MVFQTEIEGMTGISLPIKRLTDYTNSGVIIRTCSACNLPTEGFEIKVGPSGVIITGADERGTLYGVYAALSIIKSNNGEWTFACGRVKDWPDLALRGMCLELLSPSIRDIGIMKRYISTLSRCRSNTLILLHMPEQILAWEHGSKDGGWTQGQIKEIVAHARSLHMDVWGGIVTRFKPATFPAMRVDARSNLYNPTKTQAYDTLFLLYSRLLHAYSPKVMLIGHDEIKGLNIYAAQNGRASYDVFAEDVNRIRNWLFERGVGTAMWGDMLLNYHIWPIENYTANSRRADYISGATDVAIGKIANDVIIIDWHYHLSEECRTVEHFRKHGFAVVGCSWHDPVSSSIMAKSIKSFNGLGVIGTDWGFWRTLSRSEEHTSELQSRIRI